MGKSAPSFSDYHSRMLRQILKDARGHLWGNAVPLIIAVIVAFLQAKFGLIKQDQTWTSAFVNAAPYAAILIGYLIFHLTRARWKLDQERHKELVGLGDKIGQSEATVTALRTELSVCAERLSSVNPLHFKVGRRLESASYGANGHNPVSAIDRIAALQDDERLAVNHDLLGVQDPAPTVDDKFLTITLSETLKQGDLLLSPSKWLKVNSAALSKAPMLRVSYERVDNRDWLKFEADREVRNIYIDPLLSVKTQSINPFSAMGPVEVGNYQSVRVGANDPVTGNDCPLLSLVHPDNRTSDTVTVHYSDADGNRFSRTFDVFRRGDSIEWKPKGPPTLQGL